MRSLPQGEAETPLPDGEQSPRLCIVYQLSPIMPPQSSFDGKVYLYPRQGYAAAADGSWLYSLNTRTGNVESEAKPRSDYLLDDWFFTTDAYLYRLNNEAVTRSDFNGEARVDLVPLSPLGGDVRFISAGGEGALYFIQQTDASWYLAKYDFAGEKVEKLWEETAPHRTYMLAAVSGASFILREGRRTDTDYSDDPFTDSRVARYEYRFVQYTLGQTESELSPYGGTRLPELFAESEGNIRRMFTDPYTNTQYYCAAGYDGAMITAIEVDSDTRRTISFDKTALAALEQDGCFGERIRPGVELLPHAATADGFIVPVGVLKNTEYATPFAYGYIAKEDYNNGVFNVVPFDYGALPTA